MNAPFSHYAWSLLALCCLSFPGMKALASADASPLRGLHLAPLSEADQTLQEIDPVQSALEALSELEVSDLTGLIFQLARTCYQQGQIREGDAYFRYVEAENPNDLPKKLLVQLDQAHYLLSRGDRDTAKVRMIEWVNVASPDDKTLADAFLSFKDLIPLLEVLDQLNYREADLKKDPIRIFLDKFTAPWTENALFEMALHFADRGQKNLARIVFEKILSSNTFRYTPERVWQWVQRDGFGSAAAFQKLEESGLVSYWEYRVRTLQPVDRTPDVLQPLVEEGVFYYLASVKLQEPGSQDRWILLREMLGRDFSIHQFTPFEDLVSLMKFQPETLEGVLWKINEKSGGNPAWKASYSFQAAELFLKQGNKHLGLRLLRQANTSLLNWEKQADRDRGVASQLHWQRLRCQIQAGNGLAALKAWENMPIVPLSDGDAVPLILNFALSLYDGNHPKQALQVMEKLVHQQKFIEVRNVPGVDELLAKVLVRAAAKKQYSLFETIFRRQRGSRELHIASESGTPVLSAITHFLTAVPRERAFDVYSWWVARQAGESSFRVHTRTKDRLKTLRKSLTARSS